MNVKQPTPAIDRILARVVETPGPLDTPCWVTSYRINYTGYLRMGVGRSTQLGHRVSYEHFHGPIPDGLEIDHLCRNRACVSPHHLEAVSHSENVRRGNAAAFWRNKTHCPHGHEYSPENTIRDDAGHRFCRACRDIRNARRDGRVA